MKEQGKHHPARAPEEKEPSATRRSQGGSAKGWYWRGYVPHFDGTQTIQHVTFHLRDSLPSSAIQRMQAQVESMADEQQAAERRKRIHDLLDSGLGSCVLRRDDCAEIIEQSLLFGNGHRYNLLAWCIMPNHVHVLIQQLEAFSLGKIVQSWKRHSAREIHRILDAQGVNRPCPDGLWQRDYWDRFIRDERHYQSALSYIEENPVMAGLVADKVSWRWGSAWTYRDTIR